MIAVSAIEYCRCICRYGSAEKWREDLHPVGVEQLYRIVSRVPYNSATSKYTFLIFSAFEFHSLSPFFSVIVSTRRTTWVAEIFEADEGLADVGFEEILEERSNLNEVGELRPVPGIDGEYAPLLGPELVPPPPAAPEL